MHADAKSTDWGRHGGPSKYQKPGSERFQELAHSNDKKNKKLFKSHIFSYIAQVRCVFKVLLTLYPLLGMIPVYFFFFRKVLKQPTSEHSSQPSVQGECKRAHNLQKLQ